MDNFALRLLKSPFLKLDLEGHWYILKLAKHNNEDVFGFNILSSNKTEIYGEENYTYQLDWRYKDPSYGVEMRGDLLVEFRNIELKNYNWRDFDCNIPYPRTTHPSDCHHIGIYIQNSTSSVEEETWGTAHINQISKEEIALYLHNARPVLERILREK